MTMTKDEALKLALSTLKEVREETFRLMRNGERLYAEDKVWSTIISIQETLETKHEFVQWEQFHEHMAGPNYVAPQSTWVGLTEDDRILIKHDANFNQFMTAGEYADRTQQLTEARLKDLNK